MIIWSPRTQIDLQEAHQYIAENNERAADRVADAIRQAGESLRHFPRRGRRSRVHGRRELIVQTTPYFLVYRIARNGDITISRVMHMARNWPRRR